MRQLRGWRNPLPGCNRRSAATEPKQGILDCRGYTAPAGAGQGALAAGQARIANPGELAYYVCFGPAETALEELVRVAGTRWAIEECFE